MHEHMFAEAPAKRAGLGLCRGVARYFCATTIVLTVAVTPSTISTTTM